MSFKGCGGDGDGGGGQMAMKQQPSFASTRSAHLQPEASILQFSVIFCSFTLGCILDDAPLRPFPSEPVLVIDQCKDSGPRTKHQGPWQQEAGPASSTVDNGPQRSAFIIEAYETFD
uniref:HDC09608 n=1 Tax=Drosophila melanogaster TaxID=7227 RepID=Q6ILD4_DROME|nr:TPA_inf: HDC09608 [Drosophila melanogaster]